MQAARLASGAAGASAGAATRPSTGIDHVLRRPSTLLLVLAVLTALRLASIALSRTDLFFDEAQYWAWSRDFAFGYFSKPPLIAWIIGATTSICGNGEACVRIASPLFHAGTALLVASAANALFDRRIAILSGLAFATLPGIAFSATLISTDVPLLFFWALALNAWIAMTDPAARRRIAWPLILGAALGLGLLAKYAMVYFLLCAAIHLLASPSARRAVRPAHAALAAATGLAILSPNLMWNLENGLATFRHTAENADWNGLALHPGRAGEFLLAQFGVFGPILFAALLVFTASWLRAPRSEASRLLASFSLPVIALILVQALASRAYANWAATAYPAATILVVAWLVERRAWRWLGASFALHAFIALLMLVAPPLAPSLTLPGGGNPFSRVLGWRQAAAEIGEVARSGAYAQILADDRLVAAELTYYLRDLEIPVTAWRAGQVPRSHYEQAAPYRPDLDPALYVTLRPDRQKVTARFTAAERLAEVPLRDRTAAPRAIALYRLDGAPRDAGAR